MIARVDCVNNAKVLVTVLDKNYLEAGMIVEINGGKRRTLSQNALYWLLLEFASRELGYSAEELHDIFKAKFLSREINAMGQNIMIVKSTATLSKQDFGEYFDKINTTLIELGVNVAPFWSHYEKFLKGGRDEKK